MTTLDPAQRRLIVAEQHILTNDTGEVTCEYEFVMRCWTTGELESALATNGFGSAAYFGAYDPTIEVGSTDRLVVVAHRTTAQR